MTKQFKQQLKPMNILKSWLNLAFLMVTGWFLYIPTYLFFATGIYIAVQLTDFAPSASFLQCLGLIMLIRYLKNAWSLRGNVHVVPDLRIDKEPYQIDFDEMEPGLYMYGNRLVAKTETDAILDCETGKYMPIDVQKFSPIQLAKS